MEQLIVILFIIICIMFGTISFIFYLRKIFSNQNDNGQDRIIESLHLYSHELDRTRNEILKNDEKIKILNLELKKLKEKRKIC